MRFTVYRDKAHRGIREARPGEQRPGVLLSQAPGGVWIMPTERRPGDPKVAFLGHRSVAEPGGYYALLSENASAR